MKSFSPKYEISIAICTWNPNALVEETFKSLAFQSLPRDLYEVLVIDNGSEFICAENLVRACDEYGFRYVLEPELGLSAARNRAIKEAISRYVYFIDDDAVAPAHLLETLLACFQETGAKVIGGPAHGLWERTPPRWFGPRYWRSVSLISYGSVRRPLHYPEIALGCNVAFEKRSLENFDGFRSDLGRVGNILTGNEERDLLRRMMNAGATVYYEPRAYVFHAVSVDRMTVQYLGKRSFGGKESLRHMMKECGSQQGWMRWFCSMAYWQLVVLYQAALAAYEHYVVQTKIQFESEKERISYTNYTPSSIRNARGKQ
jgi:glucosyl-dolichyl phosphate glucuronosyltransferase